MKKRVLVIDDESDLCALIKLIFMRENYNVECVYSLAEASSVMSKNHDIIFLDNNLPDGLGSEYLHNHPDAFDHSYNVLMSAHVSTLTREQASKDGIDEFIQKPFSIHAMKEIIRKAG